MPPAFGGTLRMSRHLQGMTMAQLALKVGCSESLISKIECDRVLPSLQLLHRLVQALGTNIASLMTGAGDKDGVIARAGERPVLVVTPSGRGRGLKLESLSIDRALMQANIHIIAPGGGSNGAIQHEGEEVGYVLQGVVEMTIGERRFRLGVGDSFYFRSDHPHAYVNVGQEEARILWVNSPATF
ncbi:XRE family transcriptional regulator [Telmatospirillum siberiense]|uniref:XRE family transcriptional regulator n=2 Tax=Telmatospirillum siberiense TaxID=382514 RepID=A0A2N3PMR9_9PROT|nr:XRE family transcriptional regulator [Telmatospirillum siberiense]